MNLNSLGKKYIHAGISILFQMTSWNDPLFKQLNFNAGSTLQLYFTQDSTVFNLN